MTKQASLKKVIKGLEMSYKYSCCDEDNTIVPQRLVLGAVALLKAQEAVKPIENAGFYYCGACRRAFAIDGQKYCPDCGRAVKWW